MGLTHANIAAYTCDHFMFLIFKCFLLPKFE